MNYEEFKNQRITVKYNNNKKGSGFGELYVLSGLYSVKASTHCEGNDCTWSCEIDSKKEFQFQFPKPSTLTSYTNNSFFKKIIK
ncbi:hypothetical protein HMI54_011081 [Coelomomyces lativittatus]|nr:hypothetical protein HMI54_011081 [Coelomomyces lativittatus]